MTLHACTTLAYNTKYITQYITHYTIVFFYDYIYTRNVRFHTYIELHVDKANVFDACP